MPSVQCLSFALLVYPRVCRFSMICIRDEAYPWKYVCYSLIVGSYPNSSSTPHTELPRRSGEWNKGLHGLTSLWPPSRMRSGEKHDQEGEGRVQSCFREGQKSGRPV